MRKLFALTLFVCALSAQTPDYRITVYDANAGKYIYPKVGTGFSQTGSPNSGDKYCKNCTLNAPGSGAVDLSGYVQSSTFTAQMAGKANATHAHATADVTGLDTALAGKLGASASAVTGLFTGTGTYLKADGTKGTPSGATFPSTTALFKGDGAGGASEAVAGTDYLAPGDGTAAGLLKMLELSANGNNFVAWQAPDSLSADTTYTMPSTPPSGNQFLQCGTPSGNVSACQFATVDLSGYATTSALTTGLAGKADTTALSGYATTSALTTGLAGKANTTHTHAEADVTNLTTDLAAKQSTSEKGQANGYASLGSDGKVPSAQLPTTSGVNKATWDWPTANAGSQQNSAWVVNTTTNPIEQWSGNSEGNMAYLRFNGASNSSVARDFRWPSNWSGAAPTLRAWFSQASISASKSVKFDVAIACGSAALNTAGSYGTAVSVTLDTGAGGLDGVLHNAVFANIPVTGCTAGSMARLRVLRDTSVANNQATGAILFLNASFEYGVQ